MARRRLDNLRSIVTGASSGIGRHLTLQLAEQNVNVVAVARRADRLNELTSQSESLSGNVVPVVGDVTDPAARKNVLETCHREFGGLDLLINNAGTTAMGPFVEASPERLRQIFEVNFFALAEMTREAIPLLKAGHKPMIVNIGSVLGHRATPLKTEYCASKFAVHGFSDAIRGELSKYGIDLLLVSPSTTDSDLFDRAIEDTTEKNWKKSGAMGPEIVAQKTIRAIRNGRHEIILSAGGRLMVWLDRIAPSLANRIVARYGQ